MPNKFLSSDDQRGPKVERLFTQLAPRYDLANDLQSFGLHRLWKRRAVRLALGGVPNAPENAAPASLPATAEANNAGRNAGNGINGDVLSWIHGGIYRSGGLAASVRIAYRAGGGNWLCNRISGDQADAEQDDKYAGSKEAAGYKGRVFHRTTCTVYCALCINFLAFSEKFGASKWLCWPIFVPVSRYLWRFLRCPGSSQPSRRPGYRSLAW